jgi:hypothetical protein
VSPDDHTDATAGPADDDREERADARELEADRRDRQIDARERTLDRWEEQLVGRAAELSMLDDEDVRRSADERLHRSREHERRRADAELRRDEAIDREIERGRRRRHDAAADPDGDASTSRFVARLATDLQAAGELEDVLQRILVVALEAVRGCDAASIVLTTGGTLAPAASTHPWAARLDEVQIVRRAGPLLDAIEHGVGAATDLRRPGARGEAERAAGALSYGLTVGGDATGAVTFYSRGGAFDAVAVQTGEILAAHASVALDRTLERLTFEARAEAWQHALESRDVIGQAKGILMEQHGVGGDEAFRMLRDLSQRSNRRVRDLAAHIVEHRRLPDG